MPLCSRILTSLYPLRFLLSFWAKTLLKTISCALISNLQSHLFSPKSFIKTILHTQQSQKNGATFPSIGRTKFIFDLAMLLLMSSEVHGTCHDGRFLVYSQLNILVLLTLTFVKKKKMLPYIISLTS